MNKKRLEDALIAAKAIQAGFNINDSAKIKQLELLYRVNCIHKSFDVNSSKIFDDDEDGDEYENIQVLSLQFNQQGNILAAGDSNGRVQLFDVFSGKSLEEDNIHISKQTTIPAISVKWHPIMQNILYSANANGSIMMYDRDKKHQIMLMKENNDTTCIDINSRGKYMATAGKDHRIRLYDLASPEIELAASYSSFSQDIEQNYKSDARVSIQLEDQAHSSRVFSIKFHKEEADTFFTAGWDRTVKIWDRRSKSGVINTIYGPSVCGDGIDHKENYLLTASWLRNNALQLWDLRNIKKPMNTISLENADEGEYLYAAKFCDTKNADNKKIYASGSGTKCVHLIDYEKSKDLSRLKTSSPLYCLDTVYSGCIFATGSTKNFHVGIAKS